jgi:glycosyltransferase involved in cell wall biosynthesis
MEKHMTSLRHRVSAPERRFEISVVIPTVGRSPHLRGLLERLQLQATNFDFEVLVVANIPQQSLRKLVGSMGAHGRGTFEYLETGRLGVNLARNKGLERARAPLVLFLDDDALLDDDSFLESHCEAHRKRTDAVAIGGPYRLTAKSSSWDLAYHRIAHEWLHHHTMSGERATQLLGGNMSVKKHELVANGWTFDEAIAFGGAETGLCLRITNAKRRMYFLDALAIGHAPEMTSTILRKKAYLQGAGASWRSRNIAAPKFQFVNEFATTPPESDPRIRRARELYQACFDFGWSKAPYDSKLQTTPHFNLASYYVFLAMRKHPLAYLRRLHRRIYATVRTAWINGARSRPTSTR